MEKYLINPNQKIGRINPELYGHFAEHLGRCVYEGFYVGEDSPIPNVNGMRRDVVEALRAVKIPVLRWPGGCFADRYHWKDGIGPKENRTKMVNGWGNVLEDNFFGTHEFFELCRQLGCKAYVNGNVGSGTVQEMKEWVEYMTCGILSPMVQLRMQNGQQEPWKLDYFGVGNENWGCGGHMRPEQYADEYRRYETFVKDYDSGRHVYRIAGGPNVADYNWTEVLMKTSAKQMDGLSLHYYTIPGVWEKKGKALEFTTEEYHTTIRKAYRMEELVQRHSEIMNRYDPEKRVGLIVDEWGTWYDVEEGTHPGFLYQQNTMRDAIVAGVTLNIFNKHCDRVKMANLAQTNNVLQAMILTDGEDMLLTPTYFAFMLFADHGENTLLGSFITSRNLLETGNLPQLVESASMKADGTIISTVVNTSADKEVEIHCQVADFAVKAISAKILMGEIHDYNSFENKDTVELKDFSAFEKTADGFRAVLPPCAIVKFTIR